MADADVAYTRLHITPFTPALLNTFLPASILPNARNISYHNIQTFPEKGYGYVELPTMDAEKIKKKLSGSILKGTKVKIEKARPEKEIVFEPPEPEPPKREKRKRKRDELPGVDIGERQVKRGWTTPAKDIAKSKDKKTINKSKYTTNPECLFKTNLPPNVASKSKSTEVKPDTQRKRKAGKETVVHEFAKTTKYATFLRSSGSKNSKGVAEYVDGKGWVDEEGNLVEEVMMKKRKNKTPIPEPPAEASESSESEASEEEIASKRVADPMEAEPTLPDSNDSMEDLPANDSSDDSESDEDENEMGAGPTLPNQEDAEQSTSSDDSSDDSSSEEELENVDTNKEDSSDSSDSSSSGSDSSESSDNESEVEEPQSAITNRSHSSAGLSLSIKIPASNNSTPISSSVHPLEALYKRSKADAASSSKEAAPSFSFFGADGDEEDVKEDLFNQVPLTPFTQRDFEYRGMRSAAPTPDTAHPNKRFIWPTENGEDEDDEETEVSSPIRKGETSKPIGDEKGEPESEFQKWFWENRGNVDRSWKARRRAVAKEKRQRENRKRQDRAL